VSDNKCHLGCRRGAALSASKTATLDLGRTNVYGSVFGARTSPSRQYLSIGSAFEFLARSIGGRKIQTNWNRQLAAIFCLKQIH